MYGCMCDMFDMGIWHFNQFPYYFREKKIKGGWDSNVDSRSVLTTSPTLLIFLVHYLLFPVDVLFFSLF